MGHYVKKRKKEEVREETVQRPAEWRQKNALKVENLPGI